MAEQTDQEDSKKMGAEILNAVSEEGSKKKRPFMPHTAQAGGVTGEGASINKAGVSEKYLKMFEHDSDEVIIAEITKHPIGLVAIWSITGLAILTIGLGIAAVTRYAGNIADSLNNFSISDIKVAGMLIGLCLIALAVVFGYIAAFLYSSNRIILTSEKLVQIRYFSLFNSKVSSLSIGDVQDVSSRHDGILPSIFGFGKISIETAGEQDNYEFPLATNATEYSKMIVQAHEENLHQYGN